MALYDLSNHVTSGFYVCNDTAMYLLELEAIAIRLD